MSLAQIPADVFVLIAQRTSVRDVLALRRVSRRLYELTHLRSLWHAYVCFLTACHGIPRTPSQYLSFDTHQLELLAKRPILFQDILLASASNPEPKTATIPTPRLNRSRSYESTISQPPLGVRREMRLPNDDYGSVKMIRGGKWLLSMSVKGLLRVWNMESSSEAPVNSGTANLGTFDAHSVPQIPSGSLRGEQQFDRFWSLLDGDISSDGSSIYILLAQDRVASITILSMDISSDLPPSLQSFHSEGCWRHIPTFNVCSFRDTRVIFRGQLRSTLSVLDWKNKSFGTYAWKAPVWADQIWDVKIVDSQHLVVVHGAQNPSRCNVSMYKMPLLEPLPLGCDELPEDGLHPDAPSFDVVDSLVSYDLKGMHHVQDFGTPSPPTSHKGFNHLPCSPTPSNIVPPGSRRNPISFTIGTVMISDPFWVISPYGAGSKRSENGVFRICIAVESMNAAQTRTRLLYSLKIDLNLYNGCVSWSGGLVRTGLATPTSSPPSSKSTLDDPSSKFASKNALKPTGRMTSCREGGMYFCDRLAVAVGLRCMISAWTSADGVRIHITPIGKAPSVSSKGSTTRRPKTAPSELTSQQDSSSRFQRLDPPAQIFSEVDNSLLGSSQSRGSSSRASNPPSPLAPSLPHEGYRERGVSCLVYPWSIRNSLPVSPPPVSALTPSQSHAQVLNGDMLVETETSLAEFAMLRTGNTAVVNPRQRRQDLIPVSGQQQCHIMADMYTGRIVVVDTPGSGRTTAVRILELIC